MKSIKLIVLVLVTGSGVFAQQLPYHSQYMFNQFYLNPAVAGTEDYNPAMLNFRSQWTGFEGAPLTQTASVHGRLMDNMGVGGLLINDKTGPMSQMGFQLSYSYHIKMDEKSKLALGLSGMLFQHVINYSELTYVDADDLAFQKGKERSLVPDAAFGAYYYAEDYYLGLSVPQLFHSRIYFTDADQQMNKHVRHYFLNGGYRFEINQDLDLEPSVLLRAITSAPMQMDLNAKILYKDLVWLGTSYRHQDALVFMLGFQKGDFMGGYSYDATLSNIRNHSSGSHELFLGYNIPALKVQPSPSIL